jgi:hypothetical protein
LGCPAYSFWVCTSLGLRTRILRSQSTNTRYENSDVIVLRLEDKDKMYAIIFAPNPARNGFTELHINAAVSENLNITLFDAIGRAMYRKDIQVNEGLNQIWLDLNKLPNGVCFAQLKEGNNSFYKQLQIIR